jgi:hypothetical protein
MKLSTLPCDMVEDGNKCVWYTAIYSWRQTMEVHESDPNAIEGNQDRLRQSGTLHDTTLATDVRGIFSRRRIAVDPTTRQGTLLQSERAGCLLYFSAEKEM